MPELTPSHMIRIDMALERRRAAQATAKAAAFYTNAGDLDEGERLARLATEIDKDYFGGWQELALVLEARAAWAEAAGRWWVAVTTGGGDNAALSSARCYIRAQDWAGATKLLRWLRRHAAASVMPQVDEMAATVTANHKTAGAILAWDTTYKLPAPEMEPA